MSVELLSRIQFAFTIAFHYIYTPLSIGIGVALVIMEGLYIKTKNPIYQQMTKFWVRIFALTFALGVATGIVMEFEFGLYPNIVQSTIDHAYNLTVYNASSSQQTLKIMLIIALIGVPFVLAYTISIYWVIQR